MSQFDRDAKRAYRVIVWLELASPLFENWGSWVMNVNGTAANNWSGTTLNDSPAVFHVNSSTLSWADGHASSRRWLDAATVAFSSSMDPNKSFNPPSAAATARDVAFLMNAYPFLGNQ